MSWWTVTIRCASASSAPVKRNGLAVEENLPGVGLMHPGDDLGERRLAGAVLADEAADAAGRDGEVDAAQRADRREALHEPRHSSSGAVDSPASRDPRGCGLRGAGSCVMNGRA